MLSAFAGPAGREPDARPRLALPGHGPPHGAGAADDRAAARRRRAPRRFPTTPASRCCCRWPTAPPPTGRATWPPIRTRYVLELLLADESNPRSVAFQAAALLDGVHSLPRQPGRGRAAGGVHAGQAAAAAAARRQHGRSQAARRQRAAPGARGAPADGPQRRHRPLRRDHGALLEPLGAVAAEVVLRTMRYQSHAHDALPLRRHGVAVPERGAADAARAAVAGAHRVAHRGHAGAGRRWRRTRTTSATTSPRSRFSRATTASPSWPRASWTCSRARAAGARSCRGKRCATSWRRTRGPRRSKRSSSCSTRRSSPPAAELAAYARPSFPPGRRLLDGGRRSGAPHPRRLQLPAERHAASTRRCSRRSRRAAASARTSRT